MRMRMLCLLPLLGLLAHPAAALDFPPQDHAGEDIFLYDGDRIWGSHTNIGLFEIEPNAHVTVLPYSPDIADSGGVDISAMTVRIYGILDATGAGMEGGGGGGAGGGSAAQAYSLFQAEAGKGADGGKALRGAGYGESGSDGFADYYGAGGGNGGNGSNGQGQFYGTAGAGANSQPKGNGPAGQKGTAGGYLANAANGDESMDKSVVMGSGGGGGGGGAGGGTTANAEDQGAGGGGGGAAGGSGGGYVRLHAAISLDISGSVLSCGTMGQSGQNGLWGLAALLGSYGGDGGAGGSSDQVGTGAGGLAGGGTFYSGGNGGDGGAGAGGGILLWCEGSNQLNLAGGTIDARGGNHNLENGGTVKIFFSGLDSTDFASIHAGRIYKMGGVADTTPPYYESAETTGARDALSVAGEPSQVLLRWYPASDNLTVQSKIRYSIYSSLDPAEVFSSLPIGEVTGKTEAILQFLPTGGAVSYFGVRARDLAENREMNSVIVMGPHLTAVKQGHWKGYK